jgi:hypothetical protein
MSNPKLVALIPVHKKDPNITKKNGWKMPAKNLLKAFDCKDLEPCAADGWQKTRRAAYRTAASTWRDIAVSKAALFAMASFGRSGWAHEKV